MALKTLKPRVGTLSSSRVAVMQPGSWRTSDMTSAQRGYGHRWRKARDRFLRANPLCVMCKAHGDVTAATVVDHIEPHRGDQALFWDESNWAPLCAHHHSSDKQREENSRAI